jgi:hypothetical protein
VTYSGPCEKSARMGSLSDYAEELGLRLIAHPVLQPLIVVGKIKNVGRTKLFANSTLHHKVAERRGYSSSSAVILHTITHPLLFFYYAILNEHVFRMTNFNSVARVYMFLELKLSMF